MTLTRPTTLIAAILLYLSSGLHISLAVYHLMMPVQDRSEFAGLHNLSDSVFSMLTVLLSIVILSTTHQLGRTQNWPYLLNALMVLVLMPVMAVSGIPHFLWMEYSLNKEVLPIIVLGFLVFDLILKWMGQHHQKG